MPDVYFNRLLEVAPRLKPEMIGNDKLLIQPDKLNAKAKEFSV